MSKKRSLQSNVSESDEPPTKKHKAESSEEEYEYRGPDIVKKHQIPNLFNDGLKQHQTDWIAFLSNAIGNRLSVNAITEIAEFYEPSYQMKILHYIPDWEESYDKQIKYCTDHESEDDFSAIAKTVDYIHIYIGYEAYLLPQLSNNPDSECLFVGDNSALNSPFHSYWDEMDISYNKNGKYVLREDNKLSSLIHSNPHLYQNGIIFKTGNECCRFLQSSFDMDLYLESFQLICDSGLRILQIKHESLSDYVCKPPITVRANQISNLIKCKISEEKVQWNEFLLGIISDQLSTDIIRQLALFYQPSYCISALHSEEGHEWSSRYDFVTQGRDSHLYSHLFGIDIDIDYVQIRTGYETRILNEIVNDYPECVFLQEKIWNSPCYLQSIKYNKNGEYLLDKDNGNTKYVLSVIDSNPYLNRDGIILKGKVGLDRLNDFLSLHYCSNYGLITYKYIYDSGLRILYLEYDTESG